MKSVCLQYAHSAVLELSDDLQGNVPNMLHKLKGLFFYATPHLGSLLLSQNRTRILHGAPLTPLGEDMLVLSTPMARLNGQFNDLQNHFRWNVYGVGEMLETELGHGIRGIFVPSQSAGHGMGECFSAIPADHYKICKPDDKNAVGFQLLTEFIRGILQQGSITNTDGMSSAT